MTVIRFNIFSQPVTCSRGGFLRQTSICINLQPGLATSEPDTCSRPVTSNSSMHLCSFGLGWTDFFFLPHLSPVIRLWQLRARWKKKKKKNQPPVILWSRPLWIHPIVATLMCAASAAPPGVPRPLELCAVSRKPFRQWSKPPPYARQNSLSTSVSYPSLVAWSVPGGHLAQTQLPVLSRQGEPGSLESVVLICELQTHCSKISKLWKLSYL